MSVVSNLANIHKRIRTACDDAGREHSSVRLVLATKTVAASQLREAYSAGERLFGESRLQEAEPKIEELRDLDIDWHFIGHVQSNKVNGVLRLATCIHSVDRRSLVDALESACAKRKVGIDILLEVNTSEESSKNGCALSHVAKMLEHVAATRWLRIRGFMTIGALSEDPDVVRACFTRLREIRESALTQGRIPADATELSMGMSSDLELAIAEGATLVRVGSAVFGNRVEANEHASV